MTMLADAPWARTGADRDKVKDVGKAVVRDVGKALGAAERVKAVGANQHKRTSNGSSQSR